MIDDGEDKGMPCGFKVAIAALLVVWIGALLVLSRFQGAPKPASSQISPPVYPSAVDFRHAEVPDRDWRSVTYYVAHDYPSLEVFGFYDDHMLAQGWTREESAANPQWNTTAQDKGRRATLVAGWVSPDELMRLDLALRWTAAGAGENGRPEHMQVDAIVQRTLFVPSAVKSQAPKSRDRDPVPFSH